MAAAVDKEGEKQAIKALQELLRQLYELETIAGDFTQPSSQQLLQSRMQDFQQALQGFKDKADVYKHLHVPNALLSYVDDGGHPDDFVRMQFRRAATDSQVAAGRVAALQAMQQELLAQCEAAFPDDAAVYKSVVEHKEAGNKAAAP